MQRIRLVMLVLLVALAGVAFWNEQGGRFGADGTSPPVVAGAAETPATTDAHDREPANEDAATPAQPPGSTAPAANDDLPPEAHATLALIAAGGPFPYDRDGLEFRNFEGRLPRQPRGWYHEYTVPTPGLDHRGPRRIVTGGNPPRDWYYTDDHYASFREIEGPR